MRLEFHLHENVAVSSAVIASEPEEATEAQTKSSAQPSASHSSDHKYRVAGRKAEAYRNLDFSIHAQTILSRLERQGWICRKLRKVLLGDVPPGFAGGVWSWHGQVGWILSEVRRA